MADVYAQIGQRIRELAKGAAHEVSPPVQRWKVVDDDPLVIEQLDGDIVLEEDDDDFEISDAVVSSTPEVGDLVIVHYTGETYVATGLVKT